jgi:hypothetical protein
VTGGRLSRLVVAAVVVGGAAAFCFCLGLRYAHEASGESPGEFGVIDVGTPIAVFSSDPTVQFDISLVVSPLSWTLSLRPLAAQDGPASVSALVAVSEGWHLDLTGSEEVLEESGIGVSYRTGVGAAWLDEGPHQFQLLRVPFTRTESGYLSGGRYGQGIARIPAGPGERAVYRTPAGKRVVVPSLGRPPLDCALNDPRPCGISDANFTAPAKGAEKAWFGPAGPSAGSSIRVELILYGDWQLGAANPPPDVTDDRITWTSGQFDVTFRSLDFEILSTNQAASSQRNLLWAGILFGIGGSLVASTIVALGAALLRSPTGTPPASPTPYDDDPCDDRLPPGGLVAATALLILVWIGGRKKRRHETA